MQTRIHADTRRLIHLRSSAFICVCKFLCESCGYAADADCQAAVNILNRGLTELGIKLAVPEDIRELTPKDSAMEQSTSTPSVEPGNESDIKREVVGVQLSLFDLMDYSSESPSKSLI